MAGTARRDNRKLRSDEQRQRKPGTFGVMEAMGGGTPKWRVGAIILWRACLGETLYRSVGFADI